VPANGAPLTDLYQGMSWRSFADHSKLTQADAYVSFRAPPVMRARNTTG
jgi:hypothetical protein